jgi:hypothetical protein
MTMKSYRVIIERITPSVTSRLAAFRMGGKGQSARFDGKSRMDQHFG